MRMRVINRKKFVMRNTESTGDSPARRQATRIVRCWGYLITSRWDGDDVSTLSLTKDRAWEKFCYPALRREAYEAKDSGYRVKRVPIERVIVGGKLIRLAWPVSSERTKTNVSMRKPKSYEPNPTSVST